MLQTVDQGFNVGIASIRERWDEQRIVIGDAAGPSRLIGLGSAIPPSRLTAAASLSEQLVYTDSDANGPVPADGMTTVCPKKVAIDLKFAELSLTLKPPAPPTTILRGVTGELKAGRLTAIMGPSGRQDFVP